MFEPLRFDWSKYIVFEIIIFTVTQLQYNKLQQVQYGWNFVFYQTQLHNCKHYIFEILLFSATQLYKSKYNMFEILYFTTQYYTIVSAMSSKYSYLPLHNYTRTMNYSKYNMVEILYFTKHNCTIVSTIFLKYFFSATQLYKSKYNMFEILLS